MSKLNTLGLGSALRSGPSMDGVRQVVLQRPLDRIFAFTGYDIDDVVEDPIARNVVWGYYKLYKQIGRTCEIVDLERQWNR